MVEKGRWDDDDVELILSDVQLSKIENLKIYSK